MMTAHGDKSAVAADKGDREEARVREVLAVSFWVFISLTGEFCFGNGPKARGR